MHTFKGFLVLLSVFASVAASAAPAAASGRPVSLPAGTGDVRPLGVRLDPGSGRFVEGYAIIHRKQAAARGGQAKPAKPTQCYGYLATGAKWKQLEPWVVNPSNASGLSGSFVASNLASDIAKWEDAADGTVGAGPGANILGDGSVTGSALSADNAAPDNVNEVYFAPISDPGTIAVTTVWGIFSGPTFQRSLVEWDQVYNDADYAWSASGEAGKMDFENIATHELGHAVGLADLYNTACASQTMFGYASLGETQKRDLNTGDITGVNQLY